MTDEEMADEYAHNHLHYEVAKREDGTDYAKEVSSVTIKQAYLAGLNTGRPKWHKVADGDLPPKDDVYLIYTTKGYLLGHYEQGGTDGEVDYCGEPYSDFREYPSEEELMVEEVIAWCEIPTFDKE